MIYFAQATEGGPIKIGFSARPSARIKALEGHYGKPLAILATMEGGRPEEAELHARFAALRIGRTEQFCPGPDLMAFIGRPLFVNQGDVELMAVAVNSRSIGIRVSADYAEWIERFAKSYRMTVAGFVDHVIAKEAKAVGFEAPPERIP